MESSDTVEIVVSGKSYPNISKKVLASNSEYFRALFEDGFSDSSRSSYSFPDKSTTAFEVLLDYISSGNISFQGKDIVKVLEFADFLCIDSFATGLQKYLMSGHGIHSSCGLPLAVSLNVEREYVESCFQKFELYQKTTGLPHTSSEYKKVDAHFGYEFLTIVTGMDRYWRIKRSEYCYVFFDDIQERINYVLHAVLNNPPNLKKMKVLIKNLHLECFPWNSIKQFLCQTSPNLPSKKCMILAVKHHFNELQQEIGNKISCIRMCYVERKRKSCNIKFLEFNFDSWTWVLSKTSTTISFEVSHCVMSRDYANLFSNTGLQVFRKKYQKPKCINNIYIGEISKWTANLNYVSLATCVLGKYIYMFFSFDSEQSRDQFPHQWYSQPMLFKLDVFSNEFTDCTSLPLAMAQMVAKGKKLYIAGCSPTSDRHLKVYCFNTLSGEVTTIVDFQDLQKANLDSLRLVIKNHFLYIFFNRRLDYLIVDTRKGPEQAINPVHPDFFLTQGWYFNIVQLCATEDGIMLLLDVDHRWYNCDFLGLSLAHLNTETGLMKPLGFLPNPKGCYWLIMSPLQVQMESRRRKGKKLMETKGFAEGIDDLENSPSKGSSSYNMW